jgi:divalent metal cation (Fe/Co/Zn/Cd) transporter
LSLEEAHEIAAKVKYAILEAIPNVVNVLVHMEPYKSSGDLSKDSVLSYPPV